MDIRKRFTPKLIACYLLVAVLLCWAQPEMDTLIWGFIPIVLGEALRIWGTGHLQKNEAVIVSGPYAYIRDPLYVGTLLILSGFCVAARVYEFLIPVWACFFLYYLPYKKRREGNRLSAKFGATYDNYRKQVMAVFPRLSPYKGEGSRAPWSAKLISDNSETGTAVSIAVLFALLLLKYIYCPDCVFPDWHWL
ncbi:MAG: isoprenylcysteine carboxylmethyltransferase family protein [Kiritimatiellia bacterium]